MKKLLLIDGSSLIHRAFYALPLLSNKEGIFTNAVHGFMMMLNKLVDKQNPDYLIVAFDKSRITFRNDIYPEYKATRSETPHELKGQFELIKDVLDAANIHWEEAAGYEADDIIGTYAALGEQGGMEVQIFSGDKDLFQLIDEHTTVFLTKKGISEIEPYDITAIKERYGVGPGQLIEIKGLMGDNSDNIPGVLGVGEKTAIRLIGEYGTIDNLYANLSELKGKLVEKLDNDRDSAYKSRELGIICRDMPLSSNWSDYIYNSDADKSKLISIYQKLGLGQLLRLLNATAKPKENAFEEAKPFDEASDDDRPWQAAAAPAVDTQEKTVQPCDRKEIEELCAKIRKAGTCAIYATWQDAPIKGKIEEFGVAVPGGEALQIRPDDISCLGSVLSDSNISKELAYGKELRLLLLAHDIPLTGIKDDLILAAYLLDPAKGDYSLADLALSYGLPVAEASPAYIYAGSILSLSEKMREDLADVDMLDLYIDMELPLASVLADMEKEGIRVEGDKLAQMSAMLATKTEEYQADIYKIAEHEFNINSPKQLGVVLFEELGIPPLKKTKTGYSTDAEVLDTLSEQWEIAARILDYRMAAKLKSTYTDGLRPLINSQTGKIHTSYKQTVTATGRLSSVEPNLQNIPVRHELGRRVREVFTVDKPEDILLAADYNQIELRVLAHISADAKLIEAFRRGEDIHSRTASEVLGIASEQLTPAQRRQAKAVNFGIVYGISDYGLSRDLGISRAEAADYIALYFQRYPKVAEYQRNIILESRQKGYVATLCGRRRYLPELHNPKFNVRSLAERMAINTPIQGSAADIIKLAMIKIAKQMQVREMRSKMILQVHDELIFNVVPGEEEALIELVKDKMANALQLTVPLTIDMKNGKNWYDMEKIDA